MYRDDKFDMIPIPENLDEMIDRSIEKGIQIKKKHRKKKIVAFSSVFAAAIAVFSLVCLSFPALAAQLPLIGKVFEHVEEQVSYKGDYSSTATQLVNEEEVETTNQENPYVQTQNGITITVSEVNYTSEALYLAISIKNEEGFPNDFICTEYMEGYILEYDRLGMVAKATSSFLDQEVEIYGDIEGQFEDNYTFIGIYRIDLGCFSEEISTGEYKEVEAPDDFKLNLEIIEIYGDLFETEEKSFINKEGIEETYLEPIIKRYDGSWAFDFDVSIDSSQTQTAEVNNTNEQGVGIAKVVKTPYEITAEMILPEGVEVYDYFMVICDAEGDQLDFQGEYCDTYQTYGRNTDTVYVYICDDIEYMDELKGYYWSEDYQENKKTKTFKQFLDERALYGVEITF